MTSLSYTDRTAQDGGVLFFGWAAGSTFSGTFYTALGFIFNLSGLGAQSKPESLTLTCTGSQSPTSLQVTIYAEDSANPSDFSVPSAPGRDVTRPICRVNSSVGPGGFWDADAVVTYRFGYEFANGAWAENATYRDNIQRHWAKYLTPTQSTGRLALAIIIDNGGIIGPSVFFSENDTGKPTITVNHWAEHTGHNIGRLGRTRATYCERSGLPAMSEDLIEDAWHEGLWVLPDWHDPDDDANLGEPSSTEREGDDRGP